MKESLVQAYSNSPRRQKLQIIGSVFMVIVISAVMLILYLVVSARVVAMGRQVQVSKDQIDHLVYISVNYRNQIAEQTRFKVMERRALEMGYRAPYPGEVFYVPVPGYESEQVIRVVQQDPGTPVVDVNRWEYHQGLLDWVGEKIRNFLRPFEGL